MKQRAPTMARSSRASSASYSYLSMLLLLLAVASGLVLLMSGCMQPATAQQPRPANPVDDDNDPFGTSLDSTKAAGVTGNNRPGSLLNQPAGGPAGGAGAVRTPSVATTRSTNPAAINGRPAAAGGANNAATNNATTSAGAVNAANAIAATMPGAIDAALPTGASASKPGATTPQPGAQPGPQQVRRVGGPTTTPSSGVMRAPGAGAGVVGGPAGAGGAMRPGGGAMRPAGGMGAADGDDADEADDMDGVDGAADGEDGTQVDPSAPKLSVRLSTCTDVPPGTRHTCEEQRMFNKCEAEYMIKFAYCSKTCGHAPCQQCDDNPPTKEYTCEQQKKFGKCGEEWIIKGGYCAKSCGRLPCPPSPQEMHNFSITYARQHGIAAGPSSSLGLTGIVVPGADNDNDNDDGEDMDDMEGDEDISNNARGGAAAGSGRAASGTPLGAVGNVGRGNGGAAARGSGNGAATMSKPGSAAGQPTVTQQGGRYRKYRTVG